MRHKAYKVQLKRESVDSGPNSALPWGSDRGSFLLYHQPPAKKHIGIKPMCFFVLNVIKGV